MPDVKGEITPDIAFRWRDSAFCSKAQLKKSLDSGAASFQSGAEAPRRDTMVIDASGSRNAMLASKRLDPPTPGVVKMGSDRADRALRRSWNSEIPELRGQALYELDRDPVICPPSGKETRL